MAFALKDVLQISILIVTIVGVYWNLRMKVKEVELTKASTKDLEACKAELAQKANKDDVNTMKDGLKDHIGKIYTELGEIKTLLKQKLE